jgi:hypothetical protein
VLHLHPHFLLPRLGVSSSSFCHRRLPSATPPPLLDACDVRGRRGPCVNTRNGAETARETAKARAYGRPSASKPAKWSAGPHALCRVYGLPLFFVLIFNCARTHPSAYRSANQLSDMALPAPVAPSPLGRLG